MLPVSKKDDRYEVRLFGIDNGTDTVGFGCGDYNIITGELDILYCESYSVPRSYTQTHEGMISELGPMRTRLKIIEDVFMELVHDYEPDIVGCESPFAHMRPHAFSTLTLALDMFDRAVLKYSPLIEFYKISPGSAKKATCPKGKYTSKKEEVHEYLLQRTDIRSTNGIDLKDVGPDGLDSVTIMLALKDFIFV